MAWHLNAKSSEVDHNFVDMALVVRLGQWDFSSGSISFLFSLNQFSGRGLKLPNWGTSGKKVVAPLS